MDPKYKVFIATSIDGYIADKDDGIDWLDIVPNPNHEDMGYYDFIEDIDAILMGRRSFEKVVSLDVGWPYKVPVFVLSNQLKAIPEKYLGKAELVSGDLSQVLKSIHDKGPKNLYIDGGRLIRSFLEKDLIESMTITRLPIVLGGGIPLFTELPESLEFELVSSTVHLNALVQSTYKRKSS